MAQNISAFVASCNLISTRSRIRLLYAPDDSSFIGLPSSPVLAYPSHSEDTSALKAEGESGDRPGFGRRFSRPYLHRQAGIPSERGALRVPILPMASANSSSDTPSSGLQSSATRGEPKGRAFSPILGNSIDNPLQELRIHRLRCIRRPRAKFFQNHSIIGVFVCLLRTCPRPASSPPR